MKPHVSIHFSGQCEAALTFYAGCLSGTVTFMLTWSQSPAAAEAPPDWGDKVYHATLAIGDFVVTGGDLPPDRYQQPSGFSIVLQMNDADAADRIFHALAEDGQITMALQETFWAARYGAVVDRFGITWEINCDRPGPSS